MKDKKIFIFFGILLIIIIIGGYFCIKFVKNKEEETNVTEYTPEEEISQDQLRKTIVSLYFVSKENNDLVPEARLIDIKEIINTPYEKLVNLLIDGPKNEKNKKIIPDNTTLLRTFIEGDCVTLDFSSEFLNYNKEDEKEKNNLINSLVNTLTELTEVNKVKILVNGESAEEFNEEYARKN